MPRLSPALTALLLGCGLALTLPPLPTGVLSPVVLAALFWFVSAPASKAAMSGRMFWAAFGMCLVHLWWLSAFLNNLFQTPVMGLLALLLFALEGSFYAILAAIVARCSESILARVWLLAGGWVILEALRFIGPFAFPWPTLGYALLPTPMIQIADLGGVLLASALVTGTAAALVSFWHGRARPLWIMVAVWLAALSYGITRTPGQGQTAQVIVERSAVDVFSKASQNVSAERYLDLYLRPLRNSTVPAGVPIILPETAVFGEELLKSVPGPGIYGLGAFAPRGNQAVSWDGQHLTARTEKARPVPFGEYFPLRDALDPVWRVIENAVGFPLHSVPPAQNVQPLPLNGVQYGAYVCYDSVFPWVARQLTNKGANVLVNISNDGWYAGWGVQQHYAMGRVRAIENRRWVLRSVNEGIAASVDDLGRTRQSLSRGEGAMQVQFKTLQGRTFYNQWGDLPALIAAGLMLLVGLAQPRERRPAPTPAPRKKIVRR